MAFLTFRCLNCGAIINWPATQYECSDEQTIAAFARHLHQNGYSSPVRATRGQDIMAACGQLKSETQNGLVTG